MQIKGFVVVFFKDMVPSIMI